ncbi:MAG: nucleotidyltransferase family protein [Clostridia bacterium]|nr:nucleotidyltransferase family protein [Clostridia bacterium]
MLKLETVICELNPIHNGHAYVISRAKADSDVCAAVLSGNFVQRGETAAFDKYARAHAAVLSGADLVVELPFPWCASGAESFALGGVTAAAGIGSAGLTFGSESGSTAYIEKIAGVKSSPEFAEVYTETEAAFREKGSAAVFDETLRRFGLNEMPGANDKLGAEYIRFGREYGLSHTAVKRLTEMKSATALRSMAFADCAPFMPEAAFAFLQTAARSDMAAFADVLFRHARLYLRGTEHPVLQIAAKKAREFTDGEEFLGNIATKKYTAARMRRELLFSLTGVRPEWLKMPPPYTILLAANERGRRYLSETRKSRTFPVLTKPADFVPVSDTAAEIRSCHAFADELFCLINGLPADTFMKRHPVMV